MRTQIPFFSQISVHPISAPPHSTLFRKCTNNLVRLSEYILSNPFAQSYYQKGALGVYKVAHCSSANWKCVYAASIYGIFCIARQCPNKVVISFLGVLFATKYIYRQKIHQTENVIHNKKPLKSDFIYSESIHQINLLKGHIDEQREPLSMHVFDERMEELNEMATFSKKALPFCERPSITALTQELIQKLQEAERYSLHLNEEGKSRIQYTLNAKTYTNAFNRINRVAQQLPPNVAIEIMTPYLKLNNWVLSNTYFSVLLPLFPHQAIPTALKITDDLIHFKVLVHIASEARPFQKKLALEAIDYAEKLLDKINDDTETIRLITCALIKWDLNLAETTAEKIKDLRKRKYMQDKIKRRRECRNPMKVYGRLSEPGFSEKSLLAAIQFDTNQNPERAFKYANKVTDPEIRFNAYYEIAKSRILSLAGQQIRPWIGKGSESIVLEYLHSI